MQKNLVRFLCFCVIQCLVSSAKARKRPLAPALYTFGDSIVDVGNNNYLKHSAVVNFQPYGVDFPDQVATGRFTNGYTIPDFFAKWLHLPLGLPYYTSGENLRRETIKGFNYASGSAGILSSTGRATGNKNLDMKTQVKLFEESINKYVRLHFSSPTKLKKYLSESIYVVNVGSNDFLINYLRPHQYNSSSLYNVEQFTSLLARELQQNLEDLYNLGARKFVVSQIGIIGCIPAVVSAFNPRSRCVDHINAMASIFNKKLEVLLYNLNSRLARSIFLIARAYEIAQKIFNNPQWYGFYETRRPCCASESGECTKNTIPCEDRDSHFFWDEAHPSQAAYNIFAQECFNGEGTCAPMNVLQLAKWKWPIV